MSARRAKQLIYGTLYVLVWIGFFSLVYLLFLRPSAPAGQTSCAGSACPGNAAPIEAAGAVSAFASSPGHLTFLARIANPNAAFAAASFDYRFDLEDASGTVLASFPGQSYIFANQVKYIVAPNETVKGAFDSIVFRVTNVSWVSSSVLGTLPQLTFSNITPGTSPGTVSVDGDLTNADVATAENVVVVVVFNDADGAPVGASMTEIDSLDPGQVAHFSVMYPAVPGVDPALNSRFAYAFRK